MCLFDIIPFCLIMEFLHALFDVDTVAPLPLAGLWFAVCLLFQIVPVKVVSGLLVPSCVLLVSSQPQASFLMCSSVQAEGVHSWSSARSSAHHSGILSDGQFPKFLCQFGGQDCARSRILLPVTIFALSFSTQRLFQESFRSPKAIVRPRREHMLSLGGRELAPSLSPCGMRVAAGEHPNPSSHSGKWSGNVLPESEILWMVCGEAAQCHSTIADPQGCTSSDRLVLKG